MRLWPRRRTEPAATAAPGAALPAVRLERAVVVMAVHAQQLADRLDRLERRVEEAEEQLDVAAALGPDDERLGVLAGRIEELDLTAATHEDLLEVRLHSARVATELTKVAAQLRAEIDRAVVGVDRRQRRVDTLAEVIADLSDSWDTVPADLDLDVA